MSIREPATQGSEVMRILVTGGAGYIGSVATEQLADKGHTVVVYDNLVKGHRAAVDPRAQFVEGNLLDKSLLEKTLRDNRIDAVMHFAAQSLVGESMQNPLKYFTENVTGSLNLIDAMLSNGVKMLVFSSSAATYGVPEGAPIAE